MPRNRVLSFMSQWGGQSPQSQNGIVTAASESRASEKRTPGTTTPTKTTAVLKRPTLPQVANLDTSSTSVLAQRSDTFNDAHVPASPGSPSTPSRARGDSRVSNRNSMIQTYQPMQVEVAADTPPELAPIFSYLNSHSNKLYHEGYFLKLHDLDSRGRPSNDRVWNECFAQLVGTVLSLWDAAALDMAGEDGEVVPTFINLSDASLKMIESLPMNGAKGGNLQNVLSISTAANNRYLLHFSSLNSLTQWTAAIRLAMYEHSTLQEAYTGSLIAGKGKFLNNIRQIMERSRFAAEDWVRVRFGAGTPWKRCWCVITPPDEKELAKALKMARKNPYERARMPKGDIRFYNSRRVTKKTRPIAIISEGFAAYAIYPQAKPLIEQSTLIKVEGLITQFTSSEKTTEGFVFIMPEVHAAVTGFEMMLRFLFPIFDTFALYGRPNRLIADTLDQRGLMFAMPSDRRYGYLDILDVSGLIHASGSQTWSERQWRKEMKKLTSTRMSTAMEGSPRASQNIGHRRSATSRISLPPARQSLRFDDATPGQSLPTSRSGSPNGNGHASSPYPKRMDSAPPQSFASPHKRSASEVNTPRKFQSDVPSRLSQEVGSGDEYYDAAPSPPPHTSPIVPPHRQFPANPSLEGVMSGDKVPTVSTYEDIAQGSDAANLPPPEPVITPPAFAHAPNSRPSVPLNQAPELRRAHSAVDPATLHQMQEAVQPEQYEHGEDFEQSQPLMYEQSNHSQANSYAQGYEVMQPLPYRSTAQTGHYDGYSSVNGSREQHRLSTIPGSPFVSDQHNAEYFQRGQNAQSHLSVVDETGHRPQEVFDRADRPLLLSNRSSQSIARKPVPRPTSQAPSEADDPANSRSGDGSQVRTHSPTPAVSSSLSPTGASSTSSSPVGSFVGAVIDQAVLERILNEDPAASVQSEVASSATPDYASTASLSSHGDKPPVERPRAGRMKVVGDPNAPTTDRRSGGAGRLDTYNKDLADLSAEIPQIDFGPTYSYKPNTRPGTSGTMTPGDAQKRSRSSDRLRNRSRDRLSGYFDLDKQNDYQAEPCDEEGISMQAKDAGHGRRPSMPWAPPASPGPAATHRPTQSLTPEQWVQHRAAIAAQPQYPPPRKESLAPIHSRQNSAQSLHATHQRQGSGQSMHTLRNVLTKIPPPLTRVGSGDWTQLRDQPGSRPNSRGAGAVLARTPSPQIVLSGANLTAREQMQVARATGTPLLGLQPSSGAGSKASPGLSTAPGLVGALEAREREKKSFGDSLRSEGVRNAILSRQQQQQQIELELAGAEMHRMQAHQMEILAQQQQQLQQMQQQQLQMQQHVHLQQHRNHGPPMLAGNPVGLPFARHSPGAAPGPGSQTGNWRAQYGPARVQQMQQQMQAAREQQSPRTPVLGGPGDIYVQQQQQQIHQQQQQQIQAHMQHQQQQRLWELQQQRQGYYH